MGAYLVDHPPARRQYRRPRRAKVSGGIAVHTAENTPDQLGVDAGAENVADFIRRRSDPGSYHMLCDSDSTINLVPFDAEAYHDGTGSNPFSLSVSGATQAAKWDRLDEDYVEAMTIQMAGAAVTEALWVREETGIIVPGRWIAVGDYRRGMPGFVRHAGLDPDRRTDPGSRFPDDLFFEAFNDLFSGGGTLAPPKPQPPVPAPDDWETSMFLSRYGSSQYVLVTDAWAPVRIDKSSYDELAKYGVPIRSLSNASVQILDRALPSVPATSVGEEVASFAAKGDRYSLYTMVKRLAQAAGVAPAATTAAEAASGE